MAISSQPPRLPSYTNPKSSDVRSADPDIVLVTPEELPADIQANMVLQAMGGSELIQIARNDSVDGQEILYQPIVNMDSFAAQFSPTLIIGNVPSLNGRKSSASINLDAFLVPSEDGSGELFVGKSAPGKPAIIVQLDGLQEGDVVEIATTDVEDASLSWLYQQELEIDGGAAINNYGGTLDGGDSLGYNVDITANGGNS